jgi:hypothetical protein
VEFAGRGVGGVSVEIGIELKRLGELTADWDRFAGHQLPKMLGAYDHRWLIYEGEWRRNSKGELLKKVWGKPMVYHGLANASALRKKLITLEMNGGMHRQNTRDRGDTVDFLVDLYRWWTDDNEDEHKSHIVRYQPKGLIPLSGAEQAIAAWPHLSTKRCKAVAKYFKGSIANACLAPVEVWAAIEVPDDKGHVRRLGTPVANDIVRFLRGDAKR